MFVSIDQQSQTGAVASSEPVWSTGVSTHLQPLHGPALLLAAPHRHSSFAVAAGPTIEAQTLVLKGGEVRVVRDLHRHP